MFRVIYFNKDGTDFCGNNEPLAIVCLLQN